MSLGSLQDFSKAINEVIEEPQSIFQYGESECTNDFNSIAKILLDPISKEYSVLDEIYTDGLDAQQVYGQVKMVLEGVTEKLLFNTIPDLKERVGVQQKAEEDEEKEEESEDDDEEEELVEDKDEESDEEEEVAEEEEAEDSPSETLNEDLESEVEEEEELSDGETNVASEEAYEPKKDAFGLNDEFFDIDEFNKQILALEEGDEQQNDDEEDIDYFGSISDEDEEEEEMPYFEDFYNKPGREFQSNTKTKSKLAQPDESEDEFDEREMEEGEYDEAVGSAMNDLFADEDEEEEEKPKSNLSSFEKQQQELQAEISKLEAELVADKKWTMKGEIASKDRPQDSLLDDEESNALEFERTSKPVPVITDEVTESIEDLIRRRIKTDEFNDIPKRIITDVSKFHHRQKFELSETKLNKSLAELYEDDHNKVDAQQEEISEEIKKQHDEIADLFTTVNHHLDTLCSAHYVPKPHQFKSIEIKVSDNAGAISMEDAQPTHVSSESTLAPQEIYKIGDEKVQADGVHGRSEVQLRSGLSYSKDELTREDKQRLRRAAKRKKSKHFNELKLANEQREKQDGGDKKRQKVSDVIDTISRAKNVTIIGKKGEMTDAKGNLKKANGPQGSSNFKL